MRLIISVVARRRPAMVHPFDVILRHSLNAAASVLRLMHLRQPPVRRIRGHIIRRTAVAPSPSRSPIRDSRRAPRVLADAIVRDGGVYAPVELHVRQRGSGRVTDDVAVRLI